MQKKHCLLIVAVALIVATFMAASPVQASSSVRFYTENPIYAGLPPPPPFPGTPNLEVKVMIESPYSWMGTADGIIGFTVSVRVDPRALKVADIVPGAYGEDFLENYALYLQYLGYDVTSASAPPAKDAASGTMWGYGNGLTGTEWDPALGGAGGNAFTAGDVAVLCVLKFVTVSETQASLIDLMGPGMSTEQLVRGIDVTCRYTDAAGNTYTVEPEDGYYVDVVDTNYLDSTGQGYDPAAPLYTDWHELAPLHSEWWSLESWDDNNDDVLSESDQVDMICTDGPNQGKYAWYHVEWVNPDPVPGDGIADLIVKWKEDIIPEFPLGISVILAIAPMIAVIYLWRHKRSE